MAQIRHPMMKFSKQSFSDQRLPEFLLNIYSYAHGQKSDITFQYCKWCSGLARQRWLPEYLDFDFVVDSLLKKKQKTFTTLVRVLLAIKRQFTILSESN